MDPQDNIRVAKQAYDNFKTGNIPALLDQIADRVEWQVPDIEGVPLSGKRKGREEVAGFFKELAEEEDVIRFELREFIAQGDKVVALGTYAFRVKATRREFTSDFAHVFTVQNGKIVRFQEYMDTAQAVIAYRQKAAA